MTQVTRVQSWFDGLARKIADSRRVPRTPMATWVAAATFVVVSVVAVVTFPYEFGSIQWSRLLWTALILVPATAVLNGLEFHLGARLTSLDVKLDESFRVGLYGSAANNLPIPGAVMVRVGAMTKLGSKLGRATAVTVATGILWISMAVLVAGFVLWADDSQALGLVLLSAGGVIGVLTGMYLWRGSRASGRTSIVVSMVAVEGALVISTASRFYVALWAIGVNVTASQAAVLALSVVLAAAVGVVPAGLGIRELVAGLLAPLVSLEPSLGLAATVLDRTVAMVSLALLTLFVGWGQMRKLKTSSSPDLTE